jgi:hypothetical protein
MEGSMSEGELDRLRRAVERLMAGHREALGVIDQEVEDQESSAQETLAEVQDILSGAYEDAQTILEEGGSMTDRRSRDDEREVPSREEETQRLEDKERRSDELQEAWRRNHPSQEEEEEGRQGWPGRGRPA